MTVVVVLVLQYIYSYSPPYLGPSSNLCLG